MTQLDSAEFVLRHDPKGMYRLTTEFPLQCRKALEIARQSSIRSLEHPPKTVLLTGLGGSAAGGDLARALMEVDGRLPFSVNRDYHLPAFVGPDTLVIACSYSGNTEETLSAYQDAKNRGAKIIVITSGGVLLDWATADGYDSVTIPAGQPPRTALGYLFIPVLAVLEKLGLLVPQNYEAAFELLEKCVPLWAIEVPAMTNPAKQLAQALFGKLGILYGLGSWQGAVAYRWKGQIGENGKNLAFSHTFPELNHNEILGWVQADKQGVADWVVLILEDGSESAKMKARAQVTSNLIQGIAQVHRVQASGVSLLERMLSLTLLGDFVSLYLAALNDVDPENIDWINHLKSELGKVN